MTPGGIYLENDFLQSPAVKAIKSPHTFRVLLEFYRRRKMKRPKDPRSKHSRAIIMNNGEIEFHYRDAIKRMNLSQTTFSRCLNELVELGFIDIAEFACGLLRQATKYSISDRWKWYGQPDFVSVKREHITPPFARKRKNQLPHTDNNNA